MLCRVIVLAAAVAGCVTGKSAQGSIIVWGQGSGGNGHGYEYVESALIGWDDASAIAQSMSFKGVNGHLATITDGAEQYFINSIPSVDPGFFGTSAIGMWLGGFQANPASAPDEGWAWVTGEEWNFTNWAEGEPNDSFEPESHLAMYVPNPDLGKASSGWSDQVGTSFHWFGISGFLVEYDVPAPGALAVLMLVLVSGAARRR